MPRFFWGYYYFTFSRHPGGLAWPKQIAINNQKILPVERSGGFLIYKPKNERRRR